MLNQVFWGIYRFLLNLKTERDTKNKNAFDYL